MKHDKNTRIESKNDLIKINLNDIKFIFMEDESAVISWWFSNWNNFWKECKRKIEEDNKNTPIWKISRCSGGLYRYIKQEKIIQWYQLK